MPRPPNRLKQASKRKPHEVTRKHGVIGENIHKRRVIERDRLVIDRRTTIIDLPTEVKRVKIERTENEPVQERRRRVTKAQLNRLRGR